MTAEVAFPDVARLTRDLDEMEDELEGGVSWW